MTKQISWIGEKIGSSDYFYALDHLWSVRGLTDNAGASQASYSFNAYGQLTAMQESISSDFQFAGYYSHERSSLNLTRMRAYSSKIGRWISRDPINEEGGLNMFSYVLNRPISATDPLGLDIVIICDPKCLRRLGHCAILISNDDGTWTYYSTDSHGGEEAIYDNLSDFFEQRPRYTEAWYFMTTPESDAVMRDWAHRRLPFYNPFCYNCSQFSGDVAHRGVPRLSGSLTPHGLSSSARSAGGIDISPRSRFGTLRR